MDLPFLSNTGSRRENGHDAVFHEWLSLPHAGYFRYCFTAMPCTSNRASKSSVPTPTNALAGNSLVKYVL